MDQTDNENGGSLETNTARVGTLREGCSGAPASPSIAKELLSSGFSVKPTKAWIPGLGTLTCDPTTGEWVDE